MTPVGKIAKNGFLRHLQNISRIEIEKRQLFKMKYESYYMTNKKYHLKEKNLAPGKPH